MTLFSVYLGFIDQTVAQRSITTLASNGRISVGSSASGGLRVILVFLQLWFIGVFHLPQTSASPLVHVGATLGRIPRFSLTFVSSLALWEFLVAACRKLDARVGRPGAVCGEMQDF